MSTSSTPGNAPDGRTDRTWECARADGQAMPSQRSASAAGARWQQSPSGQRDRVRVVDSRPRNQREWSNGTPERDGVPGVARARVDLGDAEVGARRRVGVLVVRRVAVGRGEHLAARPLAAHPLALDRAGGVGGEDDPVVLVGLVDHAARVVLHEVAGHVQVMGDEVGDPVGGHLVGDGEHVDQVLDGEVAAVLRGAQERDGGLLGDQHRGGEVVRLDPLAQEVGEVARRVVAEQEVAECLQDHRARRVPADRLLLDVDPARAQVGQRPDGARQVG